MTQDDRVTIEKCLDAKTTLCHIAQELGKDPTTIAKEIKKHRTFQQHNTFNDKPNRCALAPSCHIKNLCEIFAPSPASFIITSLLRTSCIIID